jgi:hypothetical protein
MAVSAEVQAGISRYLLEVSTYLGSRGPQERRELLAELEDHIHEALSRRSGEPTPSDLAAVLAEMAPPESYAAAPLDGLLPAVPAARDAVGTSAKVFGGVGLGLALAGGATVGAALVLQDQLGSSSSERLAWVGFAATGLAMLLALAGWRSAAGKAAVLVSGLILAGMMYLLLATGTSPLPYVPDKPAPATSNSSEQKTGTALATQAGSPAKPKTAEPPMVVATAEELIKAIGSNRTIELASGEYFLSDVKDRALDFVRWDAVTDGKSITIRKVEKLRLMGTGEKPVRLLVRPRYAFVLNFEDCKDVTLENLTLGHAPQPGECDSGVVGAKGCAGLKLRQCDLFGCGTEGLVLENVEDFAFDDSVIRDCTYGIMTVKGCRRLSFSGSRFAGNKEFWGVKFKETKGVEFLNCTFKGNVADGPLFDVTSSSDIRAKGGEIADNETKGLAIGTEAVKFENVKGAGRP